MKLILMLVGRTTDSSLAGLIEDYVQRIGHYTPFEVEIIPPPRKTATANDMRIEEGKSILAKLQAGDCLVLLDEHGVERTSSGFATWLQHRMMHTAKRTVLLIGGAYGFSEEVRQRAQEAISLSRMTFPHQLVRLIFVEQLYRAFTILHGQAYHHE